MARYQAQARRPRGRRSSPICPFDADDRHAIGSPHDGVSCIAVPSDHRPERSAHPRASSAATSIDTTDAVRASAQDIRPVRDRQRPARRSCNSSTGFRPTEGAHIRQSELCATCHTLYHEGARTRRAGHRPAAGADAVIRNGGTATSERRRAASVPHAGRPGDTPITSRPRRAARGIIAPHFRRRQLLHAAHAEPLSRRPRRRRAAAGARIAPPTARIEHCRRKPRQIAIERRRSRRGRLETDVAGRESERPQASDRVSVPPRLAACHGARPRRPGRVRIGRA